MPRGRSSARTDLAALESTLDVHDVGIRISLLLGEGVAMRAAARGERGGKGIVEAPLPGGNGGGAAGIDDGGSHGWHPDVSLAAGEEDAGRQDDEPVSRMSKEAKGRWAQATGAYMRGKR